MTSTHACSGWVPQIDLSLPCSHTHHRRLFAPILFVPSLTSFAPESGLVLHQVVDRRQGFAISAATATGAQPDHGWSGTMARCATLPRVSAGTMVYTIWIPRPPHPLPSTLASTTPAVRVWQACGTGTGCHAFRVLGRSARLSRGCLYPACAVWRGCSGVLLSAASWCWQRRL